MKGARRWCSRASFTLGAVAVVSVMAASPSSGKHLPTERGTDTYAAADAYVRAAMAATGTPGLAYAIVDSRGILHHRSWGRDGRGDPVTASTPFLWGSVSKPVTATVIMTLVEAGRLDLDAPIRRYMPDFRLADEAASGRITARHLLTHASGIPNGVDVTDRFGPVPDPYRAAVEELAAVVPRTEPGRAHEYTSANYLVLGALVEAITGRRYEEVLDSVVLSRLDMAGAILTPAAARERLPPGHRYLAGRPVAMTTPYDATGPSYGYLGGNVVDLARFAIAQLRGGEFRGERVVSSDLVEAMHTGAVPVAEHTSYGLGWRDTRRGDVRMVWHGGAAPGYQAMIILLPDHDRAVIMLQNVYGAFHDAQLAAMGSGVARILVGEEPTTPTRGGAYPFLLAVLGFVAASSLAALSWSLRRLVRPYASPRGRRRIVRDAFLWTLGGAGTALVAVVLFPTVFGVRLGGVILFAPDLGWLLAAIGVLAGLIVPIRLMGAYRQLTVERALR